jgi:hypothetical protein
MPRHENLIRGTRHQNAIRVIRSIYGIIRISFVVIFAAVSLHASAAGFGRKLNIHGQNMPLKQVFDEIKKQTGYVFIVNEILLEKSTPVTIYASGATLTQVLTECMKDQPVTFKIVRKTVYIMEKWVVILMAIKMLFRQYLLSLTLSHSNPHFCQDWMGMRRGSIRNSGAVEFRPI